VRDEAGPSHERDGDPDDDARLYLHAFLDIEFDEASAELTIAGTTIVMEPRPRAVLGVLLRQAGQAVSREELLATVWQQQPHTVSDNVVANAISKLRRAFGPQRARVIRTVNGIGYLLDAQIRRTVLSRQAGDPLQLEADQTVPGREAYRLQTRLSRTPTHQVWTAIHPADPAPHVLRFAASARGLAALKRERGTAERLRSELGERDDLVPLLGQHLSTEPFWLAWNWAGDDLLRWAADTDQGLPALDRAQRVALVHRIAVTVADAHAIGVLHRGLKPSSVLVARHSSAPGGLHVRLVGFDGGCGGDPDHRGSGASGLSGATMAEVGAVDAAGGSCLCVAPEVLQGQPSTTRSDLHALGVILYQTLVGDYRRPLLDGWQNDIDDPLLQDDIAAATQRDPARRTSSVAAWAEQLAALPARRQAATARIAEDDRRQRSERELARARARRPWVVASGALLVAGLGTSLWFAQRSHTSAQDARAAQAAAELASHRSRTVADFLQRDLMRAVDVLQAGDAPAFSMNRAISLAADRLEQRFADRPADEAIVRAALARALFDGGARADGMAQFRRAVDDLAAVRAADDLDLLALKFERARFEAISADIPAARRLYDETRAATSADTLTVPSELSLRERMAAFALATVSHQLDDATRAGEAALSILHALRPNDLHARAAMTQALADNHLRNGQPGPARALLKPLLQAPYAAGTVGPMSQAHIHMTLAKAEERLGRRDDAVQHLTLARDTLARVVGPDHAELAQVHHGLSGLHHAAGALPLAIDAMREARRLFALHYGEDQPMVRHIDLDLAQYDMEAGRTADALSTLAALKIWFQARGTDAHTQHVRYRMGRAFNELGHPSDALAALQGLHADAIAAVDSGRPDQWRGLLRAEQAMARRALKMPGSADDLHAAIEQLRQRGTGRATLDRFEKALH